MYELSFEGEKGSERYEICIQALLLTAKKIEVSEWDEVVALLRKLKKIGRPTTVLQGIQLYDLQEGGASLLLEKNERTKLLEFIEQPIWRPHILEQVMDVKVWLKDMTEVEVTKKPELVPNG